jgi:2-amino-4-hydroxy-6-hydroxymethyldihydropteridine diphosphokinase
VAVSSVFETDPVGGPEQSAYLNAVLVVDTTLAPDGLLVLAHRAEAAFDRTREVRWGPRTLDVDVLAVGSQVVAEPDLVVPHPRAHERAFVLVPWAEADPDAVLPGAGRVADLAAAVPADGVRRRPDLELRLPMVDP